MGKELALFAGWLPGGRPPADAGGLFLRLGAPHGPRRKGKGIWYASHPPSGDTAYAKREDN